MLGRLLYSEIKKTEINVSCIIDQNADYIIADQMILKPEELEPDDADLIIVTAVNNIDTNIGLLTADINDAVNKVNSTEEEFNAAKAKINL